MNPDNAVAMGILIGAGLLASLYVVLKFCLWWSKTDERIATIEKDNKNIVQAVNSMVQNLKGKQNDNAKVARKEFARPEKTS